MKKKIILSICVFLLIPLLSGCQLFFIDTESIIATKVAEAIDERLEELEVEESVKETAAAAATSYPTSTPYPAVQQETSYGYDYSAVIGTPGGCLNAAFISETVLDNSVFMPGDGFLKSWTIQNTGYCDWKKNFRLIFLEGNAMGGDLSTYLTETVSPGERITFTVNLTAPSVPGTYRGEWRVQSNLGVNFARFWVQIIVD